jgi:hypothetical protein
MDGIIYSKAFSDFLGEKRRKKIANSGKCENARFRTGFSGWRVPVRSAQKPQYPTSDEGWQDILFQFNYSMPGSVSSFPLSPLPSGCMLIIPKGNVKPPACMVFLHDWDWFLCSPVGPNEHFSLQILSTVLIIIFTEN